MRFTTNTNVCVPEKPKSVDWSTLKWGRINRHVRSIQQRIYRARRNNDFKKVRDLQRLLMRSDSAYLVAIFRVTVTNKGRLTPGIDGFRVTTDKGRSRLFSIMRSEKMSKHRPKPAHRTYIPKKNGKMRSLGIPTIKDRVYQEILRLALEPEWEAVFEPTSYGFRPKRGPHDAIERIFYNARSGKWAYVFDGDFKSCFDTLSHEHILNQIKGFPQYNLVKRFLEAGYVDNGVFNRTNRGTPQGGILSPLLANIALHGMEETLSISYKRYTKVNSEGETVEYFVSRGRYRIVRYADDFVIFAQSQEDIDKVPELLKPYLDDRGLTLAEDKTHITHIKEGFDFLGFNTRLYSTKDGDKCLIKPSKDSVKRTKAEISERFRLARGSNVETLIDLLNSYLKGVGQFWSTVVAKKAFSKIDFYVWNKVWRFLRRLHPNKGSKWIKNRYFPLYCEDGHIDSWVLSNPNREDHRLTKMGWISIRRHIMIKHDYSPYDTSKTDYFKNREHNKRIPSG